MLGNPPADAPGYDPELVGLPWWRRALAQGAGYYLPNVLFLAIPLAFAWPRTPPGQFAAMIGLALIIATLFVGSTLIAHWSLGRRWAWLAALAVLIGLFAWTAGDPLVLAYFAIYLTAASSGLLPLRQSRLFIPAVAAGAAVVALAHRDMFALILALTAAVLGLSLAQGVDSERTHRELARERERSAALALASERQRIGRDLHDILGHSLTTIAIKADLAQRLVARDPDAAAVQIGEVAALARQSAADVRATVSGMNTVRLASEVATARNALEAAGLTCTVPTALPALGDEASEVLGYVVREAVTNAVRHARASACAIDVGEGWVSIRDNGRGIAPGTPRTGLVGLDQRVREAGGTLSVTDAPGGGTVVRAELGR